MFHPVKSLIALAVVTAFGFSALAQGQAFSLAQAQKFATENSLLMKNATLDLEASRKKVSEIRSIGLPQINGEAKFNHFIDIPTQVIPAVAFEPTAPPDLFVPVQFGIDNDVSAGLTATQLFFDGTYIVGLQSAKTYVQLSERSEDKVIQDVKAGVAEAYYQTLTAQESAKMVGDNLVELEKNLKEMKAFFEQGLIEDTEVDQMELTVSSVRATKDNLDRQVEIAAQLLKFQMGMPLGSQISLTDNLESLSKNINESNVATAKVNLTNHPEYKLLETQENLMALNLKKEKFRRLPTLAGYASYSRNSFSNDLNFQDFFPTTVVGLTLNVPIWSSFGSNAIIAQANIELEKTKNQRSLLEQNLELQASVAKSEYLNAKANYENEKDNLALAQKILDKTIIKQRNGMASSLEVTQANAQLLTTQTSYVQSAMNMLNAKLKLDQALGQYN